MPRVRFDDEARAEVAAIADELLDELGRIASSDSDAALPVLAAATTAALAAGRRIAAVEPAVQSPTHVTAVGRGRSVFLRFKGADEDFVDRIRDAGLLDPDDDGAPGDCGVCGGSGGGDGPWRCHACAGTGVV